MKNFRCVFISTLLLALNSIQLVAQEEFQLVPGQRVRVTASRFLQRVTEVGIARARGARQSRYAGSLVMLKADTLVLRADGWEESFVIPLTNLKKLELSLGRGKSRALAGAGLGFLGGAITGSILFGELGDCGEFKGLCAMLGAGTLGVSFGITGAIAGSRSREVWQEVPIRKGRIKQTRELGQH